MIPICLFIEGSQIPLRAPSHGLAEYRQNCYIGWSKMFESPQSFTGCNTELIQVEASDVITHLQDSFDKDALLVLWCASLRCDIVESHRYTYSPQVLIAVTRFPLLDTHSSCHCISFEAFREKRGKNYRQHKKTQLSHWERAKNTTLPSKYNLLWCVQTRDNALRLDKQGVFCIR